PVRQVVTRHAGDGRVPQAHRRHRLGHPARLVRVELGRLARVDLAELAAPRALLAAAEEGRLPVLPAFVDVGAAGLLADGVQALALDQATQLGELRSHPGLDLYPRRLALDRCLRVARLDAQQPPALGSNHGHDARVRPNNGFAPAELVKRDAAHVPIAPDTPVSVHWLPCAGVVVTLSPRTGTVRPCRTPRPGGASDAYVDPHRRARHRDLARPA